MIGMYHVITLYVNLETRLCL